MYESKILKLKEVPLFSFADISQIVSGKEYGKKLLKKWVLSKEVQKIKRNAYTFHNDPFLISTFLNKPSYISSVSALSYHRLITQIPKDIFCFTPQKNANLKFISEIRFIHTNYFFGFDMLEYMNFKIPIATPEKAMIDSIGIVPISLFEEAISDIEVVSDALDIKLDENKLTLESTDAINHVKKIRGLALTNEHFINLLHKYNL